MQVKDLLKRKLPPIRPDQMMTRDHTTSSVSHNLRHIKDHGHGLLSALEKMKVVDSDKSSSEAKRALKELESMTEKVRKHIKESKNG